MSKTIMKKIFKATLSTVVMASSIALVPVSAQAAEVCAQDISYISDRGHDSRERSLAVLQAGFKAGAAKDFKAFMAIASDSYVQHSPDLADGWEPVWGLLTNRPEGFSSKTKAWLGPHGFLDNGSFLVMFREVNRGDGTGPSKIVDLMRFDSDGKYSEHWDIRQALSKKTVSGHSETEAHSKFTDSPVNYTQKEEEANKATVTNFLNMAFNGGEIDQALEKYVHEDYVQHNPLIADGKTAVSAAFSSGKMPSLCYDIKYVVAQNDLVVAYSKVTSDQGISAVVDILRVRDGKLVEHWDVIESVPADEDMPHTNGMF